MLGRLGRHARVELLAGASLYLAAAILPFGIIAWLMRLWASDFSAPFVGGGDTLPVLAGVKGLFENGSYLTNPSLGAPGTAQFYDIPGSDLLHYFVLRIFGLIGLSPVTAVNLFYLAGYPAVGVATALVLRRLRVSRLASLGVAVLFSLLPYHYMRGEGHLFLSMYWIVPLLFLVLAWLDSSNPPLVRSAAGGRFPLAWRNRRSMAALVICAAAGACGAYYLFFSCFFIAAVGLRAALRDRDYRVALATGALVLAAGFVFVAQMVPTVGYMASHGKNPVAAVRNPGEAEIYGLRITQLLLPIDNHRVHSMANLRDAYRAGSPNGNTEANMAALGIVGSMGLLLSISALLLGWPRERRPRDGPPGTDEPVRLGLLGFLTVSALLLATVSGFSAVIAATISPQIRAYNRISVFVALFALVTLGLLADRFIMAGKRLEWRVAGPLLAVLVVVLGVLDQTPATLDDDYGQTASAYAADVAFGRQIQALLPSGASVFQLPYLPFPESPQVFGMSDYEPLRGYLHTTGLRWSYGAVKGRPDATWQEATAALPAPSMVQQLRETGFVAVWVQLNGYEDEGTAISRRLSSLLGPPTAVREDGAVAVWRL